MEEVLQCGVVRQERHRLMGEMQDGDMDRWGAALINEYYSLCFRGRSLMADIERLSIALPTPMADSVRRAVENGEYASTSEVIRDALRLWESRRQLRDHDIEVLRRRWDEGKASGRAGPLNIKRVMAEARGKFKGDTGKRG